MMGWTWLGVFSVTDCVHGLFVYKCDDVII